MAKNGKPGDGHRAEALHRFRRTLGSSRLDWDLLTRP